MIIPLYNLDNSWHFLEVFKKNNSYWIDWSVIYDTKNIEVTDKNKINLYNIKYQNMLCIVDNKYNYYNSDDKIIYLFDNNYNIISVDGTNSLETLSNVKNLYNELLYEFNNK